MTKLGMNFINFEKFRLFVKPILAVCLLAIASVTLMSRVMADVDTLGPELTNGDYTDDDTPTLQFTLQDDEYEFPISYRIEIADAPNNWSGGGNSRVVRYDFPGIQEEDLDDPFFFTVGQAEGPGTLEEGSLVELPEGAYWWRVRTTDDNNTMSDWTTAGLEESPFTPAFIVDTTGPEFPEDALESTHTPSVWSNDNDVEISWEAAVDPNPGSEPGSGLAGYYYVWDTTPGTEPDEENNTDDLGPGETEISFEDLADDNEYWFHIAAFDAVGNVGITEHIGPFYIDSTDPTQPGEPTAGSEYVTIDNPEITWTASNFAISGAGSPAYIIEYSQDEGLSDPEEDTSDDNEFTFTDLDEGAWYFQITAFDQAGNESEPSPIGSFIVDTQDPEIIDDSVSSDPSETSVVITWETDEPANSLVEYGVTSDYDEDEDGEDGADFLIEHTVEITGLLECTTYFYIVQSADEAGNSVSSGEYSFTTTGCIGNSPVSGETQEEISEADGGSVELLDEGLGIELVVLPGFLDSDAVFQIKQLSAGSVNEATGTPEGFSWVGDYVYDLKAFTGTNTNVTEFDEPIQITIYFDEADFVGIELSTIGIFRWDGAQWHLLENCVVDEDGLSVTCETENFSVFGLFGEGEAPEPTPAPTPQPSSAPVKHALSEPAPPACTDVKPSNAPDLFQIDATNRQVTLYFTPIASNVSTYAVVYGHESGQELYGVEFDQGEANGVLSYTIDHLAPHTTYYFKIRGGNGCMPGDWSNEMRVTTGNGVGVTKFYKNFIQQVISSLPTQVSSLAPVVTSNQAVEASPTPATGQSDTLDTQESNDSSSNESPSSEAAESASENDESGGGFWSWLKSLFGM